LILNTDKCLFEIKKSVRRRKNRRKKRGR
jgi:hypothetical protein